MGGVDGGDQHRVIGAGFANVDHFKKRDKKVFLGIAAFSMQDTYLLMSLEGEVGEGHKENNVVDW